MGTWFGQRVAAGNDHSCRCAGGNPPCLALGEGPTGRVAIPAVRRTTVGVGAQAGLASPGVFGIQTEALRDGDRASGERAIAPIAVRLAAPTFTHVATLARLGKRPLMPLSGRL